MTWQAGQNTRLIFNCFGDPNATHGVYTDQSYALENADPILSKSTNGRLNLSVKVQHAVSSALTVDASVFSMTQRTKYEGETERGRAEPYYLDLVEGTLSGGSGGYNEDHSGRRAAKVSASLALRKHHLKAGLEYEDNYEDQDSESISIIRYAESFYETLIITSTGEIHNRVPSVFVQDAWRIAPRLRLNAGLRWDGQYMIGSDGETAQRITNQFSPRLGFVYEPGELNTKKIFGSAGRYYEQVPLRFVGLYFSETGLYFIDYDHDPRLNPAGGDTLDISIGLHPEVKDLKGQHFDEFILGYEQTLGSRLKVGLKGIHRTQREVIEDGLDPETDVFEIGNPGRGALSFFPKLKRNYIAIELTAEKTGGRASYLAAYTLSRNYGNYTGLFDQDTGAANPNVSPTPDLIEQIPNSVGWLPNDRTHVFKFSGSYQFPVGLTVGGSFNYQSGTPLNEFGATYIPGYNTLLRKRGSAGRTSAIWDLNLRLSYNLQQFFKAAAQPRLIVDAFHLFGERKAVKYDQVHYFAIDDDGNQTSPNPNYLKPTAYQPKPAVRVGIEVDF